MKKLFLLRHGEAGFSQGKDIQRQLTQQGIVRLKKMGENLRKRNLEVDFMYCSPAQRTRDTAEILENYLVIKARNTKKSIYDGNLQDLFELLENTDDSVQNCLLVGHNPTISLLLSTLTGENYFSLQPGNFCVLEFPFDSWKMIGVNTGTLIEVFS